MKIMTPPSLLSRFLGEAVGTYLLVTFVIAAYFISLATGGGALPYAITYGLTLMFVLLFLGRWSNQFNPIVSLVQFIIRQLTLPHLVVAVAGQLLGAVLAALTVRGLTGLAEGQIQAAVPTLSPESVPLSLVTTVEGFGILFLLLAYVWTLTHHDETKRAWLPVLAGISVIPGALIATIISGAVFNPIRVLGPALLEGGEAWQSHWVYWVGPLLAALIVTIVMGVGLKNQKASN